PHSASLHITRRHPLSTLFPYTTLFRSRIDHMLSGTRANIAVKVFGDDLLTLRRLGERVRDVTSRVSGVVDLSRAPRDAAGSTDRDRKSTRLNSSHVSISYAVFCLKKKK